MVFRSTRWLVAGLLMAGMTLVGCGSRTPLWEFGASATGTGGTGTSGAGGSLGGSGGSTGGTGGATGGTGGIGGTGGTGGSGGVSPTCQGLAVDEDTLAFDANAAVIQYLPMFAPIDEAGLRLAVGVVEMPVESPGPVPGQLRLAAFDPWTSFSQVSLGPGTTPNFVVGVDQVAIDRGATDDTLAVAYPHNPAPPAADSFGLFLAEVTPDSSVTNAPIDLTTSTADSHHVRFVRRGPQGHLVGLMHGTAENHGLDISFLDAQSQTLSTYPRAGCATGTMVADAAPSADGFVFAYSSSREAFGCLNDDDTDGPPGRINVGAYNASFGFFGDVPIGYSMEDVVQFVRVIPHPEGTWLVFQYAGINAEVPPPIEVLLFSDEGDVLDGPFSLPEVGDRYHVPGVAGLGRQLVFAWPELMDPGPMAGHVAVVGAGGETFSTVFYPKTGMPFSASMSVMGAPSGDQFVVGWSEFVADSPMVIQARIARFLCVELHGSDPRD